MTEQEKTAMKAVLYLAKKNPRLRYGGSDNRHNRKQL